MSQRAQKLVERLLEEGGAPSYDYAPDDLAEYQRLKAQQIEMQNGNRIFDRTSGEFYPEWSTNWAAFEKVRNKYGGMPPKQLGDQNAQPAAPAAKYSFYPSMGGPSTV